MKVLFTLLLVSCAADSPWRAVGGDVAGVVAPDELWTSYTWGAQDQGKDALWAFEGDLTAWTVGTTWYLGARDVRPVETRRRWYEANEEAEVMESQRRSLNIAGLDLEEAEGGALWVKLPAALVTAVGLSFVAWLGLRYSKRRKNGKIEDEA